MCVDYVDLFLFVEFVDFVVFVVWFVVVGVVDIYWYCDGLD